MRLKTIGVLITALLAAFTMLYWFADSAIRESNAAEHEEELAHFGEVIFSDDETEPAAAGCARCHGPEGEGGEIPNDPDGRTAPSLRTASLAEKAAAEAPEEVEDTVEAGQGVFNSAGCAGCHGPDLTGTGSGPDISTIGSNVITEFGDFPTPSGLDQMVADYE